MHLPSTDRERGKTVSPSISIIGGSRYTPHPFSAVSDTAQTRKKREPRKNVSKLTPLLLRQKGYHGLPGPMNGRKKGQSVTFDTPLPQIDDQSVPGTLKKENRHRHCLSYFLKGGEKDHTYADGPSLLRNKGKKKKGNREITNNHDEEEEKGRGGGGSDRGTGCRRPMQREKTLVADRAPRGEKKNPLYPPGRYDLRFQKTKSGRGRVPSSGGERGKKVAGPSA